MPLLLSFVILSFTNCADPTAPSLPQTKLRSDFHYFVNIPDFFEDSIRVSIEIPENALPCTLVLPPVYADNPIDSLTGPLFTDLRITDAELQDVPHRLVSFPVGPIESPTVIIGITDTFPVTVSYRLRLSSLQDTTKNRPRLTYMNQNEGFLQGNLLFAVPFEFTLPELWRTPRDFRLSFSALPPVPLYGIEPGGQAFENAYELLFLQIILGGTVLHGGNSAGQEYIFHALSGSVPDDEITISRADAFETILDDIRKAYGPLYGSTYTITMHTIGGGLEGTNSFVMRPFRSGGYMDDVMILAHEALHNFIGIQCGDRDDPWWKEGTTFYLGYVLPVRHGFIPTDTLYGKFVTDLGSDSGVARYAPSSDALRNDLFHKWLIEVAYTKGGQIAMLLDDALHQATNNETDLNRFTAEMVNQCHDGIFSRSELIAGFAAYGAMESAVAILHEYADRPGAIPLDTLESAFSRLRRVGAFGWHGDNVVQKESMASIPFEIKL